jgi:hypothetical protein
VSRRARTRAAAAALLALAAGGILAFGQFSGTFAIFTAENENQNNTFVAGWIPPPSGTASALPTATPYGKLSLTWTSGASAASPSPNPVTGQTLLYADGGSGASASCGTYSSFDSTIAPATTTYSAAGTNVPDWWCFEIESTSASATSSGSWTSDVVTFTPLRILVPISVAYANGRNSGSLDSNDTITITFNQNVGTASGTSVCQFNSGTLLIGDSTCSNVSTDGYSIGKITGLTIGGGGHTKSTATVTVAGAVVTVKVTQNGATQTGAGTFTASNSVLASAGSLPACSSSSSPNCTVTPSGGV